MTEDQQKLMAFGKIKEGEPLSNLVSEIGVPYPKLLKWKKELQEAEKEGKVYELMNLDEVVLDQALESVHHELVNLASSPDDIQAMDSVVDNMSKSIAGLNLLNTHLQDTALKLTKRINILASGRLKPREIQQLASSLSQIQTAFFNKPGTQVAVINNPNEKHPLREFKNLMSD